MEEVYYYSTVIIFALIGLCVGSFLNVVIYRLPNEISLANPPSHCPNCKNRIKWYDNIPLLSYFFLGGKCRCCNKKISPLYCIVEVTNCLLWLFASLYFYYSGIIYIITVCIFLSALICITIIDEKHLFIPDSLQIVLLISAIVNLILNINNTVYFINGFLIGCGFFLFFYFGSFLIFKREGLGFGDVKLMAITGLMLGVKGICVAIIISVLIALICIFIKRIVYFKIVKLPLAEGEEEFAFAPYLSFGIAFSLFFGDIIADLYLSILLV